MSVIEISTFRLRRGSDEADFLRVDRELQNEFIPNLPGFLRRTTSRSHDGEWLVVTLWQSDGDAEACERQSQTSPVCRRFAGLVDSPTLRTARYTTLD